MSPAGFLWVIFSQVILNSSVGNNPGKDLVLIIWALLFGIGFPLFMYGMGLDTEVRNYGVRIRFRPFHRKWMIFDFETIDRAEALTYRPFRNYGGWGIRYGRTRKAYTVSGDKGVFLTFKGGKNMLIGSQNAETWSSAITGRLPSGRRD